MSGGDENEDTWRLDVPGCRMPVTKNDGNPCDDGSIHRSSSAVHVVLGLPGRSSLEEILPLVCIPVPLFWALAWVVHVCARTNPCEQTIEGAVDI